MDLLYDVISMNLFIVMNLENPLQTGGNTRAKISKEMYSKGLAYISL